MRTLLLLLLTACSCYGQAFTLRDPALVGQKAQAAGGAANPLPLEGTPAAVWIADSLAGADGSTVSSWTDSTNGIVLTQVGSPGGVLTNNSLNGRKSVVFRAAATAGLVTGWPQAGNAVAPIITFIVARAKDISSNYGFFSATNTTFFSSLYTTTTGGDLRSNWGTLLGSSSAIIAANKFSVLSVCYSNNVATDSILTNGVSVATGDMGSSANLQGVSLGQLYGSGTFPLDGEIAFCAVYTNALTLAQIQANVTSIKNYYGSSNF